MTPARHESLAWVCLYAGVAGMVVGAWTAGSDATLARLLVLAGGVLLGLGVVLIWLRSRPPAAPTGKDDPGRGG